MSRLFSGLSGIRAQRGFTLLEVILGLTIVALIVTAVGVSWNGYRQSQALEASPRALMNLLREAQANAVGRVQDTGWCVMVTNAVDPAPAYAELFPNTTCTGSATTRITFANLVNLSAPPEGATMTVAFEERTGKRIVSEGGLPWIAFYSDSDKGFTGLGIAERSPGTPASGNCQENWRCTTVHDDAATDTGLYPSLAFSADGTAWVSFHDETNGSLMVARYVGSGGSGCGSNGSPAWLCSVVEDPPGGDVGHDTSLAFDASGNPWVVHHDVTNGDLRLARYTGSGTESSCVIGDGPTYNPNWVCSVVDDTAIDVGQYASLAFSPSGVAWVAYYEPRIGYCGDGIGSPATECSLHVAQYVGSGGSGCGSGSPAWNCFIVDDFPTGRRGEFSDIAFSGSGDPWISYTAGPDETGESILKVAQLSPGTPASGGCAADWTCTIVDDSATNGVEVGKDTSITFSSAGEAWVSYRMSDNTGQHWRLRAARFVGSGGTGCGIGSSAWRCWLVHSVVAPASNGHNTSISRGAAGTIGISYSSGSGNNLRFAEYTGNAADNCGLDAEAGWRCENVGLRFSVDTRTSLSPNALANVTFFLNANPSRTRTVSVSEQGGIFLK